MFKRKYRAKANRLQTWNYSEFGAYFITICTKNRERFFGKIIWGKMALSKIGEVVQNEILSIWKHFPNMKVDEFVIMPDHIHMILWIINGGGVDLFARSLWDVSLKRLYDIHKNTNDIYKNTNIINDNYYSVISPKTWTIGNTIKLFKWYTTKKIRTNICDNFSWQPNYHEHIIRDYNALGRIRLYIRNNPLAWGKSHSFDK